MDPPVLPEEEAGSAEISDHHRQEILMDRKKKQREVTSQKRRNRKGVAGLPGRCCGKEPMCQRRGLRFHPWVGKIPERWKWQPTPVFLSGKSPGQRSLVGNSPWGLKRVNMS